MKTGKKKKKKKTLGSEWTGMGDFVKKQIKKMNLICGKDEDKNDEGRVGHHILSFLVCMGVLTLSQSPFISVSC